MLRQKEIGTERAHPGLIDRRGPDVFIHTSETHPFVRLA
jgi:hypothetical protein